MADRAQHQITGIRTALSLWSYLFLGLLVVGFGAVILSTSWNGARNAWIQSRPVPIPVHTADLASAGGKSDLELVLGEGSYEVVYETATVATDIPPVGAEGVFFGDFATGKHSGKSVGATTFVLSGPIKLTVSEITEHDNLLARLVRTGLAMNAYFSFDQSPSSGPSNSTASSPSAAAKKKIIILGKIEEVHFPSGAGDSRQTITILDLAPADENTGLGMVHSGRGSGTSGESEREETIHESRPNTEHYRSSTPHHVH